MKPLPPNDIEHILLQTKKIWKELHASSVFLTGGTGFFGKWLLESFLAANERFKLKASITVLSRNPAKFEHEVPHLARHNAVRLVKGNVCDFVFPVGRFTHLIHGAVDARLKLIREEPLLVFDTITQGTKRVLEFAESRGVKKFLFISSGAVYGPQPPGLKLIPEEYKGVPGFSDRYIIYGIAMHAAEALCATYGAKKSFEPKIARCFSFVGPHLPLNAHFAIGNFIRDALSGKTIQIESDGTPRRSYLYAADLAIWLWTILLRGKNMRAYNVGSEKSFSLAETAKLVAKLSGNSPKVKTIPSPGRTKTINIYLPSTRRARKELGLKEYINLRNAVQKTIDFHGK